MTSDTVGGVWTYALELARALGKQDVEVALATMGAALRAEQKAEAQALPRLQVFESEFRLEWMEDPWEDVDCAGEWLLDLEAEVRPDFIHLNSFTHGALPFRGPKLVTGHSCVLSWWKAVRGGEAPSEWDCYRARVRRGLHAADVVTAPTDFMFSALEEHYGAPKVRVLTPNGRDPERFTPRKKDNFILTAGRLWDDAKNAAALDRIARYLPWPVYAAGAATENEDGEPPFRRLQPLGRLSTECMGQWMGRAAIYALPARYEPFGLSALEAGLAGCALVLGDIPSLREVWGDAAIYIPPQETPGLQSAIELLIEDDSLRADLGARARRRALTFSSDRMATKYLTAYNLAHCVWSSRSR
jgi:glycosyltransferase involved in cell wall biosynthesis